MTVRTGETWAFLRLDPDYRAARAASALAPQYEAAPFPVRVRSKADRAASDPWRLLAWEDPDGPASPFWDIPMLDCALADDEPSLIELAQTAGASLSGLRLDGGVLVLKVERGGAAVQLRLRDAETFPEGGGIELRHGVLGLPQTMRRERDLWNLLGAPGPDPGPESGTGRSPGQAPPPGRVRGTADTGRWRGRLTRISRAGLTARSWPCCGVRRRSRTGIPTTRCAAGCGGGSPVPGRS